VESLKFDTPYLNDYLQMVEDTESPRIFHVWSAVLAISAAMGRRCYLPFGDGQIFPNHYILLVGTPGTRKTTAANMSRKLLKKSTGVKFAPSDTGFQRQGLIKALQGSDTDAKEFLDAVELGAKDNTIASLTELESITNTVDPEDERLSFVSTADKHAITIVASEFSRVIGQNNMSMMDFLGERYDGEDFEYLTTTTHIKLKNTLMNMIACTTPVSIANSLPPQAGGQGFLSRIILVYGARKYKKVPRPRPPDLEIVSRVKDVLDTVYYQLAGAFEETDDAREYCESLYDYNLEISDSRFAYYGERRYTHLIKLAMVLAASRGTQTIIRQDYAEAHRILRATEKGMPDALGEFGMNPLAMLKQEILEQMRIQQGPLTMEQIVSMFHRDARSHEIIEVVNDLLKMGQITQNQLKSGQRLLSAVYSKQNTEDAMMSLLAER
jgi:hypothetical protein